MSVVGFMSYTLITLSLNCYIIQLRDLQKIASNEFTTLETLQCIHNIFLRTLLEYIYVDEIQNKNHGS